MADLICEIAAGVATLTLNRPAARNALSRALMAELKAALDRCAGDPAVRVVVIAAAGPVFSSGHDLKELRGLNGEAEIATVFDECSALMQRIVGLPRPVIAKVQGLATAAGCQLVASCDLAIAADTARFATPGVKIGLFCSTPMVALSRAVGRKAAMEMLLTGEAVDAADAARLGLINRAVAAGALDAAVAELAAAIAERSPLTVAAGKGAFQAQLDMPLVEAYAYAGAVMTRNLMAEDAAEGIDAFLEKRAPIWRGC
ncbi:MAG TPA: enoyl-CoA hydratase [Caulobacteraceae bacterium]|nr:enoyl-CoA hydratase [Caulobacteraceae bacterium]